MQPGSVALLTGSYLMHQRCFSRAQLRVVSPKLGTPCMMVRPLVVPLVTVGMVTPGYQGCRGPMLDTWVLLL